MLLFLFPRNFLVVITPLVSFLLLGLHICCFWTLFDLLHLGLELGHDLVLEDELIKVRVRQLASFVLASALLLLFFLLFPRLWSALSTRRSQTSRFIVVFIQIPLFLLGFRALSFTKSLFVISVAPPFLLAFALRSLFLFLDLFFTRLVLWESRHPFRDAGREGALRLVCQVYRGLVELLVSIAKGRRSIFLFVFSYSLVQSGLEHVVIHFELLDHLDLSLLAYQLVFNVLQSVSGLLLESFELVGFNVQRRVYSRALHLLVLRIWNSWKSRHCWNGWGPTA